MGVANVDVKVVLSFDIWGLSHKEFKLLLNFYFTELGFWGL